MALVEPPVQTYNPDPMYRGDRYEGMRLTARKKSDKTPYDLTNVQAITFTVRCSHKLGAILYQATVGNGITIIDPPTDGIFEILPFDQRWPEDHHPYDVEIINETGGKKTPIGGRFHIIQDVTYEG